MNEILVVVALVAAGVLHGTDVFFFVVDRAALAATTEATLSEAMGRLHQFGDARMPVFWCAWRWLR